MAVKKKKKRKIQRRYVIGSLYSVVGKAGKKRVLAFVGRFKIGGKEHLIFKEQRKVRKSRKVKKSR
jgi:hypothetical protein